MQAEELVRQIYLAFESGAAPPHIDSCQGPCEEFHDLCEVASAFEGRRWQVLSEGTLREHTSALSFLEGEAFQYYLPAFLAAAVRDPDGEIAEFTMGRLRDDLWRQRFTFTPDQIQAIVDATDFIGWLRH